MKYSGIIHMLLVGQLRLKHIHIWRQLLAGTPSGSTSLWRSCLHSWPGYQWLTSLAFVYNLSQSVSLFLGERVLQRHSKFRFQCYLCSVVSEWIHPPTSYAICISIIYLQKTIFTVWFLQSDNWLLHGGIVSKMREAMKE